jgi:predicted nucleic acid-binding protein
LYVLDTNILNELLYRSPTRDRVLAKIRTIGETNVWFSIVTVHEKLFNGYIPALNNSLNKRNEVRAWHDVKVLMDRFRNSQILEFTQADYDKYKEVYGTVKKAPMDCRIAASALSRDWIVASFNAADFNLIKSRISALKFEDWSIAETTSGADL